MSCTKTFTFFFALSNLLLLLMAPGAMFGQQARPCITGRFLLPENYSTDDAKTDFQLALSMNEADSIWKKADLFYNVALFDSTSHIGRIAKVEWLSLRETYLSKISEAILGEWHWVWSGSVGFGPGETPKSCECTQKMVISKDSIVIYINGMPQKAISYQFDVQDYSLGDHSFRIRAGDQCWGLSIDPKSFNTFASDPTPGATFLNINLFSGCVCGCPHESYERRQ